MATALALTAFSVPALAADLPVRPYAPPVVAPLGYNWTGFYIGAHLGGAWASRDFFETAPNGEVLGGTNKPSGVVGGGQIGYNWQFAPNWLVGIEADVSGANLSDTVTTTSLGGAVANWHDKVDVFGTVRGRLGYVVDNWLFYGTGGFAWVDDKFTRTQVIATAFSPAAGTVLSTSQTETGWVAGAGAEWGFARNWTARVEYLHIDVQGQTFGFTNGIGGTFGVNENRQTIDLVRAGVNYLFN
jgi:outer membrane immunogenic protein